MGTSAAPACCATSSTTIGTDWGACPRSYLKRVIDRAAEHGINVQATFENEYYLAREVDGTTCPSTTLGHAPVYSSIGHDLNADLMVEMVGALEAQGMDLEQAINEYGAGQQEISIRHTDALRCADNQMKFRDTVRGVALRHGLLASFAPKPFPEQIGSGAHIHFSLWDPDGRQRAVRRRADRGLSKTGRHFIAGVAEHLPALVALTAPSYNSYRRLHAECLGVVPPPRGASTTRKRHCGWPRPSTSAKRPSYNIEFKPSDGSANPYLSLGALITAGLDGVEREREPGDACEHDPARLSAADLARSKILPLPTTMAAALDELEKDETLLSSMGDLLTRCYLAVRRSEEEVFSSEDEAFEIRNHFYRF